MRLSVLAPAAALCLLHLGCGGSDTKPNDPNQYAANNPGQYQQPGAQMGAQPGQPGYGQPATQSGYGQPGATTTAPAGTTGTSTASGGQASPIPMAAMLSPAIQAMAASEVPGMQAEGQAFAGQFQEGQTLEQPINIQAGKCYSVLASGAGIQELDIQIVAQPLPNVPPVVLAQDNTTGSNATLGGKASGCWKNATPLSGPGKVILKATRGAGTAGAQVFVK